MICLIDPETNANNNVPNIGLAYISAVLNKQGKKHIIVDQDLMPHPKDRFLDIEAEEYGISVKFNVLNEAKRITNLLHKKYPKSKIVWGGPHLRNKNEVIKLQKEFPFVEFKPGYYDQELIGNDLDQIPYPRYDDFDSFDYIYDGFRTGTLIYPIMTTRGCPHQCTFCNSDKKLNKRSAYNCFDEIREAYIKFGIKTFQILDDNFIIDKERALEFCDKVSSLKLIWMCPNGIRADMFDKEIGKAMFNSGCRHISFGIESSNPDVLKLVKKGETIERIEQSIKIAKEIGFSVNGFFIIGLPGSSFESDLESWNWSQRMGIQAHFGIFVPIPGTPIAEDTKYQKYIDYEKFNNSIFFDDKNEMVVAYETPDYPANKRLELYNKIMGYRR